ncbi:hypothetical protein KIW84_044854 [Lathyrus oleraceus]|uniref:Uncharacterized protein n=1 Tax=Pisum sativum TaxID=3888 RepID=A0A9D5AWE2_PEA|nr:hypothetical protein KIW84_044854 [Pisum sativum]
MAENRDRRPLKEFAQPSDKEPSSSIVNPLIPANNFELKPWHADDKPYPEACDLIEDMAQNHYQWGTERASIEKKETQGGIHEISSLDMMQAKMDALALKVKHMSTNTNTAVVVHTECELCGSKGHESAECNLLNDLNTDQVNYAQGNPFSNTYNPGWKNHPSFSYKNQNPIQN